MILTIMDQINENLEENLIKGSKIKIKSKKQSLKNFALSIPTEKSENLCNDINNVKQIDLDQKFSICSEHNINFSTEEENKIEDNLIREKFESQIIFENKNDNFKINNRRKVFQVISNDQDKKS